VGVTATVPLPAGPCPDGAFYCGTADIAGYGAATWNMFLTGVTISQTSCGSSYTAITEFTLASDGSILVVDEGGPVCGPGKGAAGYFSEGPNAYGHPNHPHGTWAVDTAGSTGSSPGSADRAPTICSPPGRTSPGVTPARSGPERRDHPGRRRHARLADHPHHCRGPAARCLPGGCLPAAGRPAACERGHRLNDDRSRPGWPSDRDPVRAG